MVKLTSVGADAAAFASFESEKETLAVLFFHTEWHQPCVQLGRVVDRLAMDHPNAAFFKIEAEKQSNLSRKFKIKSIPTFLIFEGGEETERFDAAPTAKIVAAIKAAAGRVATTKRANTYSFAKLGKLAASAPTMVFIRGAPGDSKSEESKELINLLDKENIRYGYYDIQKDQEVEKGMQEYSKCSTFPQLYANGKLVGGLDIVLDLHKSGALKAKLPESSTNPQSAKQKLTKRLKILTTQTPLMLFMKGTPDSPQCGFSSKIVELLRKAGAKQIGHFNILTDQSVRQGLKEFSNWPTFPQLYIDGKLIGGLDVVKELIEDDELELPTWAKGNEAPADPKELLNKRLKGLIESSDVMLFIKGSPDAPRCGFSRKIIELLRGQGVKKMGHFDILGDNDVRQGLKEYSNWKTYPQLYIHGKLVGGLDIVKEMIEDEELELPSSCK